MRTVFPVCDLHADTPFELLQRHEELTDNTCHISLKKAEQLLHHIQFYAFCTYGDKWAEYGLPEPEWHFVRMYENFCTQLQKNTDRVRLCTCAEDLVQANQQRKAAAFLTVEGAEAIHCDPGRLPELKELGIVMLNLTWNSENALAGSHLTGGGLTRQGREFVRRAQELGILIDVSHLSREAFYDLCDISLAPIMASHSNTAACCDNSRNLTDEEIKLICSFNGRIGLNLYAPFLTQSGRADFGDVRRHIDHFMKVGALHHLCLGGDLDGCDTLPEGFTDLESYNLLGQYLLGSGMDGDAVMLIFNNNMVRFIYQNMRRKE